MTPTARSRPGAHRLASAPVRGLALALVAILGWALAGCAPADGSPIPPSSAPTPAASRVGVEKSPSPSPSPSSSPSASSLVLPSPDAPDFAVRPWPGTTPRPLPTARPTRVVVPGLGIDLAILRPTVGETYPPCDVAEYLTSFAFPGQGGTTYLYAHAQEGMFLAVLRASQRDDGRGLLGGTVYVYTDDDLRYRYEITRVRRFQQRLDWAFDLPAESLVLQTSETAHHKGTKVMVVARFLEVRAVPASDAHPAAHPRRCG